MKTILWFRRLRTYWNHQTSLNHRRYFFLRLFLTCMFPCSKGHLITAYLPRYYLNGLRTYLTISLECKYVIVFNLTSCVKIIHVMHSTKFNSLIRNCKEGNKKKSSTLRCKDLCSYNLWYILQLNFDMHQKWESCMLEIGSFLLC